MPSEHGLIDQRVGLVGVTGLVVGIAISVLAAPLTADTGPTNSASTPSKVAISAAAPPLALGLLGRRGDGGVGVGDSGADRVVEGADLVEPGRIVLTFTSAVTSLLARRDTLYRVGVRYRV